MSTKKIIPIILPAVAVAYVIFNPSEAQTVEAEEGYFIADGDAAEVVVPRTEEGKPVEGEVGRRAVRAVKKQQPRRATIPSPDETVLKQVEEAGEHRQSQVDQLTGRVVELERAGRERDGRIARDEAALGTVQQERKELIQRYVAMERRIDESRQGRILGLRLGTGMGSTSINGTIYGTLAGRLGITLPHLASRLDLRSIFLEGEVGKLFGNYDMKTEGRETEEISAVGPTYLQRNTTLEELTRRNSYKLYELLRMGAEFPLYAGFNGELALQVGGYHGEQKPSLRRESTTQLLDQNGTPLEDPVTVTEDTPNPLVAAGRDLDSLAVGASMAVKKDVMTIGSATIRALLRGEYEQIIITNEGERGNNFRGTFGVEINY